MSFLRVSIVCFGFAFCGSIPAAAQTFKVRDPDFGTALSGGGCFATTDTGVAVGWGAPWGASFGAGIRFDSTGAIALPHLPNDESSIALGINEHEVIVGASTDIWQQHQLTFFVDHAVMWQNGQVIDLASLVTSGPALELMNAVAINDQGKITGIARDTATTYLRAFTLENGVLTDLGTLQATPSIGSIPNAIDPYGNVVGRSTSDGGFDHAVIWKNGQITDLHALAGIPGRVSEALDINRFGVVVGAADFGADFLDYKTATVWANGQATNLGTLGGPGALPVIESFARAINDLGEIVGTSVTSTFEVHACIWRDGAIVDLNSLINPSLGWILANAHDIGNDGKIVGEGFHGGAVRPFVLIPNCLGSYDVYGAACAALAVTPKLTGFGCPSPGQPFALEVSGGPQNGTGMLFLGAGTGVGNVVPTCALQILPLYPLAFPIAFDSLGVSFLNAELPATTPSFDIELQSLFAAPAAPFGVTGTQPLTLHFQ